MTDIENKIKDNADENERKHKETRDELIETVDSIRKETNEKIAQMSLMVENIKET